MLSRLAALADRRPVAILVVALLAAGVCAIFGATVADRLDPLGFDDPASESARAGAELDARGWAAPDLVVLVDGTLTSAAEVATEVQRDPLVTGISVAPRSGNGSAYVVASFRAVSDKEKQDAAERIETGLGTRPGIAIGGPAASFAQLNDTIQADLVCAELYAFPILFVLSLMLFRSLVAASLPLVVGALAVVGTLFALRLLGELFGISVLALNVVTALGFGLAIDYSLFMVSRYREELARFGPGPEALRATMRTAGRTVFFSSLTVAAAVASLLVFPQQFLYSIGIGGVLVSLLAAVVALVVLPAILRLLGPRVDALAPRFLQRRAQLDARPVTAGAWYRTAMFVIGTRRPRCCTMVGCRPATGGSSTTANWWSAAGARI
ncbi:MAG: MMPL family transporter [Actinomycetota bacterium]|nr:MMPL family transporter [Actinomycetota bacterium]